MYATQPSANVAEVRVGSLSRRMGVYAFALIAPFIALCISLAHPRDLATRNVVWLFTIFYGAVFFIAPESTADSVRYAASLEQMHALDYGLKNLIGEFFAEGSRLQDIYQPLLTFFVSVFTDRHWFLFASFGVLLGYVFSRNIWFLIDRTPRNAHLAAWLFIIAFAFHQDIGSSINGVRMWTALHVFVFGFLHFYESRKRIYLVSILLTPLIHFSFYLPIAILVLFHFIKKYPLPVFAFFLVSFGNVIIDVGLVRQAINLIPLPLEMRASAYLAGGEAAQRELDPGSGGGIWFLQLNRFFLEAFMIATVSWFIGRGAYKSSPLIRNLLVFAMLSYGVINMVSHIPSLGRFYNIPQMMILAAVVLYLGKPAKAKTIDKQLLFGLAPLLAINVALGLRFMVGFASIWLFIGNLFIAPFVDANIAAYDAIMGFLFGR